MQAHCGLYAVTLTEWVFTATGFTPQTWLGSANHTALPDGYWYLLLHNLTKQSQAISILKFLKIMEKGDFSFPVTCPSVALRVWETVYAQRSGHEWRLQSQSDWLDPGLPHLGGVWLLTSCLRLCLICLICDMGTMRVLDHSVGLLWRSNLITYIKCL